ncbi:hypothetical protein FQR65_LT10160 [Abscondita terminalis]|nr:hypothetical protein FQR65_LT10160 [Abscondita terminalis]
MISVRYGCNDDKISNSAQNGRSLKGQKNRSCSIKAANIELDDWSVDADLFLQGNSGSHYLYLETIVEETSDDLQSDKSESCCPSPVGWLATDSESGSVIRIENLDDGDLETERDILWPLKRRRQEPNLLGISDDESNQSLSRSSSLLQFESLERQCQDISSSSPSILSTFSFDSLETRRKTDVSPDSLEYDDGSYQESDYYKSLKIDIARPKYNSYLHNKARSSSSDSSGSPNDRSLEEYCKSGGCLKTSRSLEALHKSSGDKLSIENLSEDSGYSEHLGSFAKYKSSSIPNLKGQNDNLKSMDCDFELFNTSATYNSDYQLENVSLKFGSSYQDLTILDKYDVNPLIERFMNNGKRQSTKWDFNLLQGLEAAINIEKRAECDVRASKYNTASASEPNLLQHRSENTPAEASQTLENGSEIFFNNSVCVSSVPKDLNLTGDLEGNKSDQWNLDFFPRDSSIAVKNWDIADFAYQHTVPEYKLNNTQCKMEVVNKNNGYKFNKKQDSSSISTGSDIEVSAFAREGSYLEAMSNRVDLSDDEFNPCYMENIRKSTIVEFDKEIFKAVSQTSIPSFHNSSDKIDFFVSTPISTNIRNVISTPNLSSIKNKNENCFETVASCSKQTFVRKSSLVNHSASTSGLSDDDKTLVSTKPFGGSTGSKGVHFCPIVAEVNWHDSETTTDKDSSYSLSSTPDCEEMQAKPPTPPIIRPQPRILTVTAQVSKSQPELQYNKSDLDLKIEQEPQRSAPQSRAVSQPDMKESGSVKRRGSKVVRRDDDGSVLGSYVDGDGIMYRHSHLGDVYQSMPPTPGSSHVSASSSNIKIDAPQTKLLRPQQAAVSTMDSINTINGDTKPKKSKKLSGFFSRLASFRFSSRKTFDDSKNKKKPVPIANNLLTPNTQQRIATKDDYIYIPLKGPDNLQSKHDQQVPTETSALLTSEDATCISAKPPLPKAPPRVVGASVKPRTGDTFAQLVRSEHRTIDSGDVFPRSMEPMGLIETDLDTEVTVITSGTHVKTRSLMNLGAEAPPRSLAAPPHPTRPHKSMEFLLDKQNLKVVEPPENELQKGERVMSEHQLRIQRSLQKLTIPDWYKHYQVPRENFILKKNINRERWPGTSSKTPSLSSLGSSNHSPVLLSPTPNTQPFVRWSTSKLNSTASSPCASTRSSFNTRQPNGSISPSSIRSSFNYRQPYLGWRSQERLTKPRTPAERLASSLLIQNQNPPTIQPESPEIQTSIKEVTSAIVHYVSGLKPELSTSTDNNAKSRSNSVSPRGSQKLCWLESSFVGIRPLDAPETPVTLAENHTDSSPSNLRLELQKTHNDISKTHMGYTKPSPSSTTLEDVLDSLLGLPPSTRAPSPSHQETASANTSPSHLGEASRAAEQFRRHSEGSEPLPHPPTVQRRVSFHSSPVLRCRYSRCSKVVSTASKEARAFKNCHNCSYVYCSKACRRAHWEKHRKSCLFSRVGTLCRQVLAASKEQNDTLLQISLIARRGFLSHGQGAVKCFFPCPEAAEKFLTGGLSFLGELTYVRWTDLLPTEMGPQMYAELVKMCKNYNPDTKLVLYVTVCVVSEVPATGAVKWERQLVSRCAKMRLSKEIPIPERDISENLETLVLTCSPTRDTKSREYVFSNIQNQLKMRGVSLRRQYPEIYQQLCVYVEGKCSKFTPVTVYPKDDITGKSFMCIIMLDSDPEGVRQVSAAGIPVNTINLLHNWNL